MVISDYLKPKNLEEAYALLNENPKNQIIGGGAWMKLTVKNVNKLISLDELQLKGIVEKNDVIEIGALTTLHEIEKNTEINKSFDGILAKASHHIMGITVRNIATIGGSIMAKLAFSDLFPALLVMDAKLVFYKSGEISLKDFLATPGKTNDILLKAIVKKDFGKGFFKKVATTALDFSIINFAIVKGNDGYKISVGSTPYVASLADKTAEYLNGLTKITDIEIEKAVELVLDEIKVSHNQRSSKEYRIELIKAYIKRGIKQVMNNVN